MEGSQLLSVYEEGYANLIMKYHVYAEIVTRCTVYLYSYNQMLNN